VRVRRQLRLPAGRRASMSLAVMRVISDAHGNVLPISGQYLCTFDFEADDGRGYGTFTLNLDEALKFADVGAALEFYGTVSKRRPIREDGKPNRPLMATTMEFISVALTRQT
jgi:hypothetical protein